jgi:hypothetical protein
MLDAKQSGMPVVFRATGLRYFFFSNEGSPREAPHIHVKGGGRDAKVWLEPEPVIAESYGFNSRELARILRVIAEHVKRMGIRISGRFERWIQNSQKGLQPFRPWPPLTRSSVKSAKTLYLNRSVSRIRRAGVVLGVWHLLSA